jgi:hypothetical protein
MSAGFDCLSLPELLDVRNGTTEPEAAAHLATCPRCRALLATIPADIELPELSAAVPPAGVASQKRVALAAASTAAGALWRALGRPDDDLAWVVAVIGSAPDAEDRIVVAPVFGPPAAPTEQDLLLDRAVLGYPAFVDVANTGTILKDQLIEALGEVSAPTTELLTTLYRAVLSDGPPPPPDTVGVPVTGADDPRLLAADERRQALRRLWEAADRLVEDADESPAQWRPALAALLESHLNGPYAEWDRPTLLEASGADGASLHRFMNDQLDLTDRGDIADLAAVLHTLRIPWQEAEPAVVATLWSSPGGARRAAHGADLPIAARGAHGASEAQIAAALRASHSHIDQSDIARQQQVGVYLAELQKALDDLD